MCNLLHAALNRVKKSVAFWGILVLTLGISLLAINHNWVAKCDGYEVRIEGIYFNILMFSGVFMADFCSLFLGTEYGDGTIRNKIMAGKKRTSIYLSNFCISAICGAACYLTALFVNSVLGFSLLGFFEAPVSYVVWLFVDGLLLCLVYGAIYTFVGMLCSNKAYTVAISILTGFVLLFVAYYLCIRLQAPEMIPFYEVTEMGEGAVQKMMPNPQYLSGLKRTLYQFFMDFIPTGQAVELMESTVANPFVLALYSLVQIVGFNLAGIFLFQRKDIK